MSAGHYLVFSLERDEKKLVRSLRIVRKQLEEAREKYGVYRATPRSLQPHGTYAGYRRHYRVKEKPCDPCRKAYNEYNRKRRKNET